MKASENTLSSKIKDSIKKITQGDSSVLITGKISDYEVKALAVSLKDNKTLTEFHLSRNQFSDQGVATIAASLKGNTTLTNFSLNDNQISDQGAVAIAAFLKDNKTLTKLHLAGKFSDQGIATIAASLKGNTTLTNFNLYGNQISDQVAVTIAAFLKDNKTLTRLILSDNNFSDQGIATIAVSLKGNRTLTQLALIGNQVLDQGAVAIAASLEDNRTLTLLTLSGNQISDQGAVAIAASLEDNRTLIVLDLSKNQVSDQGAIAIATVLRNNKSLKTINLGINQISDQGATAFAASLKDNTTLTVLYLYNDKITNKAALTLLKMLDSNITLLTLDLRDRESEILNNNISEEISQKIDTKLKENKKLAETTKEAKQKQEAATSSSSAYIEGISPEEIRRTIQTVAQLAAQTQSNTKQIATMESTVNSYLREQRHELVSQQPQLLEKHTKILETLADASPQTVAFLLKSHADANKADEEYQSIQRKPQLAAFYHEFSRSLSSTLLASQTIHSQMVSDDRRNTSEHIAMVAHAAACGIGFGAGIATGVVKLIIDVASDRQRTQMVNRITNRFPDLHHIHRAETLVRYITLEQKHAIQAASEQPSGKGILEAARKTIRWLTADDIDTPVKTLANTQAARLLDIMMATDQEKPFDLKDIPVLASWATGRKTEPVEMATALSRLPASSGAASAPTPMAASKHEVQDVANKITPLELQMARMEREAKKKDAANLKLQEEFKARLKKIETDQAASSVDGGTQAQLRASLPAGRSSAQQTYINQETTERHYEFHKRVTVVERMTSEHAEELAAQNHLLREMLRQEKQKQNNKCCVIS